MKYSAVLIPAFAIVFCLSASYAEARTLPHDKRSAVSTSAPSSTKLDAIFTNDAKDVSIAPPKGWLIDQSESWSKSSDGTVDYTENVNVNGPNSNGFIVISASPQGEDTLASKSQDLKAGYNSYTFVKEGMTTIGTDPAYAIEVKDSYNHINEYIIIKNGWTYDIYSSVVPKYWKKYSNTLSASLSTLRINAVQ